MTTRTLTHAVTRLVAAAIIAVVIAQASSDAVGDPVRPDARIQAEFQRLETDMTLPGDSTDTTRVKAAKEIALIFYRLREMDRKFVHSEKPGYLMSQLIYYMIHSKNELSWAVVGYVVQQVPIHPSYQIAGVVPFLTDPDPAVRKDAMGVIAVPTGREGHGDFSEFIPYMDSPELTLWMYNKEPAGALEAFILRAFPYDPATTKAQRKAYGDMQTAVAWAIHVLDNALWDLGYGYITDNNGATRPMSKEELLQSSRFRVAQPGMPMVVNARAMEQLNMLSQRPEWYARMYAAAFIVKHPPFRTPALIARLQNDPNQLVKKVIAETLAQQNQR